MLQKWIFAILISVFLAGPALAQNSLQQGESLRSFKRGTAIVMFSGLAGGVLGLSTLSFYGEPEEHTRNITTGALVGMLAGAGYLVWESQQGVRSSSWGLTLRQGEPALAYQYRF